MIPAICFAGLALAITILLAVAVHAAVSIINEAPGTKEHLAWLNVMENLPDTDAFDPPIDLARARLVSVPLQRSLSLVAPVADDDWLEELITARPNPFTVPIQRRPGSAS